MQGLSKTMLAVAGSLVLAATAGAQAPDPSRTEEQVRQRTEEQMQNAGEAGRSVRSRRSSRPSGSMRARRPGWGRRASSPRNASVSMAKG